MQSTDRSERIRWAPKLPMPLIGRLYRLDSLGIRDTVLLDDVGTRLYDRCQSIMLVTGRRVRCPRCGSAFSASDEKSPRDDDDVACPGPGCGWQTTWRRYHDSWRHQDLIGANALEEFKEFVERFPRATSPAEKMLLIDRLLHTFHWGLKIKQPHRSAANNLIEGRYEDVLAFLDDLSATAASTPGVGRDWDDWRQTVERQRKVRGSE